MCAPCAHPNATEILQWKTTRILVSCAILRGCTIIGAIMKRRLAFAAGILILLSAQAGSAQWINIRLAGTPRNVNGEPNLLAPAPKAADGRPDLSGIWRAVDGKYLANIGADEGEPPFQPWAAALYKERVANDGKDRPSGRCLPHAVPDNMMVRSGPFKIIQTPGVTVLLFEEFNHFRQLFTDGRGFPERAEPSWFGYSVGKWDGGTFVVETIGFHDRSWLDNPGHPHSDALRVTEKFTRRNFGRLDIQITFDDPKAYTRPWSANAQFELMPDSELLESICENEKDYEHTIP
jgi:hypothetical protein